MSYQIQAKKFASRKGVQESTMMGTHCLRYQGEFFAMMFEKADSLIVKVSVERVNELIETGEGNPFNFTKKRFREWVLIPLKYESRYSVYIEEALQYAKQRA
ncbi:MAG: hypothetical protein KTR18_08195 [Acidiferrobacterales bacterium]|nr:hypothetical protein [Acidiferrobacterales bacterium]